MPVTFAEFCDQLALLQEDQSLFEAQEHGDSATQPVLADQLHQLIKIGNEFILSLLRIAKRGESFLTNFPADFLDRMSITMTAYHHILMPRKIFWGLCPCVKPRRSGDVYERSLTQAHMLVLTAVFLNKCYLIDHKLDFFSVDSVRYNDMCTKANDIFSELAAVITKGNERVREKARVTLQSCSDSVERFVKMYFDDLGSKNNKNEKSNNEDSSNPSTGLKLEALRRIRMVNDLLVLRSKGTDYNDNDDMSVSSSMSSRSRLPPPNASASDARVPGRRTLVKAQSSLQEIVNTAFTFSAMKAKAALNKMEDFSVKLKRAREDFMAPGFDRLHDAVVRFSLGVDYEKNRASCDEIYNEIQTKMKESNKRWSAVKAAAVARPVAIIEEDLIDLSPSGSVNNIADKLAAGLLPAGGQDPQRLIANTGKTVANVGIKTAMGGVKIARGAVTGAKDAVNMFAGDMATLVASTGANINVGGKSTTGGNNYSNGGGNSPSTRETSGGVGGVFAAGKDNLANMFKIGDSNNNSSNNNNNNNNNSGGFNMPKLDLDKKIFSKLNPLDGF